MNKEQIEDNRIWEGVTESFQKGFKQGIKKAEQLVDEQHEFATDWYEEDKKGNPKKKMFLIDPEDLKQKLSAELNGEAN